MKTWTASELGDFLESVKDHRLRNAMVFAASTGMRRGELLGLLWGMSISTPKRCQFAEAW